MVYYKIGNLISLKKDLNKVINITFVNSETRVSEFNLESDEYDTWMIWFRFKSTVYTSPWIQNFLKHGEATTVFLNSTTQSGRTKKILSIRIPGKYKKSLNFSAKEFEYTLEGIANNIEGFDY